MPDEMRVETHRTTGDRQHFQPIDCSPGSSLMNYERDDEPADETTLLAANASRANTTNSTGKTNCDPEQCRRATAAPDSARPKSNHAGGFKFNLRQLNIFATKRVGGVDEEAEQEGFLMATRTGKTNNSNKRPAANGAKKSAKAKLAKQETLEEVESGKRRKQRRTRSAKSQDQKAKSNYSAALPRDHEESAPVSRCSKMFKFVRRKRFYVPLLLLLVYALAVYCVPYVQIEPKTVEPWPTIPFNYHDGPLKASTASQFRVHHIFKDQVHGAESMSLDSRGNAYMAIEGGFVLFAHLNKTTPMKRHYLDQSLQKTAHSELPILVKIAELNGIKQLPKTKAQQQAAGASGQLVWRRECQLDEQIYGPQLYTPAGQQDMRQEFKSNVKLSRCSKPLGTRLSADENYLYVVDTLSGLYRVGLRPSEYSQSTSRSVVKLIDFKQNQIVPIVQLDQEPTSEQLRQPTSVLRDNYQLVNVSMRAIDDLVIDFGAGTGAGDLIYMTVASQNWPAVSFIYDALEGRPSGLIMRYDTGSKLLVVLDPNRVAHVRTSPTLEPTMTTTTTGETVDGAPMRHPSPGAPRLDENDVFDNRPLHFPNGIELTDDRQALLIADTSNKRIIKHYVRGPRSGTSDLWAWTPNFPDNIRRGYDRRTETYWVVGCGKQETGIHLDPFAALRAWPRVRKFVLKNIYLFGWAVEWFGSNVADSVSLANYGHSIRTGSSLCQSGCTGMMILQYNRDGELIRSVHSREFPNDLAYYSQANELIDANNELHALYLSSPSYNYVTQLVLPTESLGSAPSQLPPI